MNMKWMSITIWSNTLKTYLIALAIHQKFEAEGVAFAYPTQTIHLTEDRRNSPAAAVEGSNAVADASERATRSG